MVVGVPGSGIGGLYYIVLALAMPVCELIQTVRGRSSWLRWRGVSIQTGLAVGILAALAGGGWLLTAGCGWIIDLVSESSVQAEVRRQAVLERLASVTWSWMAWLSTLTLLAVILLPSLLAWGVALYGRRQGKESHPVNQQQ